MIFRMFGRAVGPVWLACALAACGSVDRVAAPAPALTATPAQVRAYFQGTGKSVLTFSGYSGAGYQDPAAMLAAAGRVLDGYDPATTIVNIGATAEGIGAVYALAKQRGYATTGIVSSQARAEQVPIAPQVDRVFYVEDASWGGLLPGGLGLSPTSRAMVDASSEYVAIGGGDIARDELLAARAAGKRVRFIAADMDHRKATERAQRRGEPVPTDFRGALHAAVAP